MKSTALLFTVLFAAFTAAAPAHAICDPFAKMHAFYAAEMQDSVKELQRVDAMKPKPKHDAALCLALRKALRDTPYFVAFPDRSCFQTDQQMAEFVAQADKYGTNAATLVGLYCSDAELKRALPPLFDGKF
jgi:hypothetical protein